MTGASGGIGRAIALELAHQGAEIVLHGHRRLPLAEKLATEIHALGRQAVALSADLANAAARTEFASAAWRWHSGIDILVNAAGADVLTGDAAPWTFDRKLQALWEVDVLATLDLSRNLGQRMKERTGRGGVILNIGWDQAEHGMAGDSGEMFAAIKGAVMAFSRSLAQSLAPQVRVNCLAPGWIRTAWGEGASD